MRVGTHAVAASVGALVLLPFVAQTVVVSAVVGAATVGSLFLAGRDSEKQAKEETSRQQFPGGFNSVEEFVASFGETPEDEKVEQTEERTVSNRRKSRRDK